MLYGHNYIVQIQYQSLQEGPQGRVNQDTRLDNRIIDLRVSKSFCIDFVFFNADTYLVTKNCMILHSCVVFALKIDMVVSTLILVIHV